MAIPASVSATPGSDDRLTVGEALRYAWLSWLAMLIIPFVLFLVATIKSNSGTERATDSHIGTIWFVAAMAILGIGVPAAFFLRSRYFKPYFEGDVVPPRAYLKGQLAIWIMTELGGIFALIGCLVSGSLIPNIVPALLAFVIFVPFRPTGRSMVRAVGASDDHHIYEDPS